MIDQNKNVSLTQENKPVWTNTE